MPDLSPPMERGIGCGLIEGSESSSAEVARRASEHATKGRHVSAESGTSLRCELASSDHYKHEHMDPSCVPLTARGPQRRFITTEGLYVRSQGCHFGPKTIVSFQNI